MLYYSTAVKSVREIVSENEVCGFNHRHFRNISLQLLERKIRFIQF